MRFLRHIIVLILMLSFASCRVGPRTESVAPATQPQGAPTTVTYAPAVGPQRTISGELVATRDDGFLLLAPQGLTLVRAGAIRRATFSDVVGIRRLRGPANASQRRTLARFSRYPFGLTEVQLNSLLEALSQERLIEVGR